MLLSANDLFFFATLFARVSGLFLLSPLLSSALLPRSSQLALTLFVSLLIAFSLYPDSHAFSSAYDLRLASSWILASIALLQEVALGYLLGFVFALLYEALFLAGQVMSFMMGFSFSEVFDPLSQSPQSSISQLLVIVTSLLLLSWDLHHEFFRTLAESFRLLPPWHYGLPPQMTTTVVQATSLLFLYGLKIATLSLCLLGFTVLGLAFLSRVLPEFNILFLSFPIRLFIGYFALAITLTYLPALVHQAFYDLECLAGRMMQQMAGATSL